MTASSSDPAFTLTVTPSGHLVGQEGFDCEDIDPASRIAELEAEVAALRQRLTKAEEVVKLARVLDSYDWSDRLDDSKTSDDVRSDARELGIAVFSYDRDAKEKR